MISNPHDPTAPTQGGEASDSQPFAQPERVGPYRILQAVGEGGMGVVYVAEQKEPVRRTVALKMMKFGMDTKEVIGRFEAERQALAVMEHPNIARVLDGGAADSGRPYFVMELVRGVPITAYCDSKKLSTRRRLELMIPVCEAVQHAHQKGIIHRDLKPSNVLVTEENGRPVPKIIDFGIAKATGQKLTEHTVVTQYGQAMGTPAYMSPEQAEMSGLDIDTRTDIYSLGVMLYELLVGKVPIDPHEAGGVVPFMMMLVARETSPPTPGARLSSLGPLARHIAADRSTVPAGLRKELSGDLQWIVLKAMDKDRNRRYETANGLAMDVRRHLDDEPVVARSPSASYRLAKFLRRNRAAAIATAAVALAIMAGFAATSVALVRTRQAEELARLEASNAEEVSAFLVDLFRVTNPNDDIGDRGILASTLLDSGAARIERELADQPLLQARLMITMAHASQGLGRYRNSRSLFEGAIDRLIANDADPEEIARAQVALANALVHFADYEHAEPLIRDALARLRRQYGLEYPLVADAVHQLSFLLARNVSFEPENEQLLHDLLAAQRANGADQGSIATTMDYLCWFALGKGDLPTADDICSATLTLRRLLFPGDRIDKGVSLSRMGNTLFLTERYESALGLHREALEMYRRMYGEEHPELAYEHSNMAAAFRRLGAPDSALWHTEEAVRIRRATLASDNPELLGTLNQLASQYLERGNTAGAAAILAEALAAVERGFDATSIDAVIDITVRRGAYAAALRAQGLQREARVQTEQIGPLLSDATREGVFGPSVPTLKLNSACWFGALTGHAETVMDICDTAVEKADDGTRPRIRDSRGVARAMAGDYEGAIADFEYYVSRPANTAGVPRRQEWILSLREGLNPFTQAGLDALMLP